MKTFPGTVCSTGEMDAEQIANANAALRQSLAQLGHEMRINSYRRNQTTVAVLTNHIANLRRMLGSYAKF